MVMFYLLHIEKQKAWQDNITELDLTHATVETI